RPFALTVTIALLASLFVSLTIVPVLAYWFLKAPKEAHKHAAAPLDDEDELDRPTLLQRGYLPILEWTLTRRWLTVAAAVLVLVGTGALVPLLPTNFIGDSGQNAVTVRRTLEPGSNLAAVDRAAQRVEDELLAIDGVDTVQVSLGSGDGSGLAALFAGGSDATYSIVTDPDADQEAPRLELTDRLDALADVGEIAVGGTGGGFASTDLEIDIRAADPGDLGAATEDILEAVRDLDITSQAES